MPANAEVIPNVKQSVPFFMVTDIEASYRFYVDGVGFTMRHEWRPERAAGRLQWCLLQLEGAALMLQEYWKNGFPGGAPEGRLGQGVSVYFICADAIAIYHDLVARGVSAGRPFVGNGNWVTALKDPDGELPRLKPRLGCLSLKRRSFDSSRLGDSQFAERRVYPS